MGKFLSDMIDFGIEAAFAIPTSGKKASEASKILHRFIEGEEIGVEEFMNMYNTRIHNFDSKQDDIKIVKKWDFEGVYIIHNCTKNIFLVGKGEKVLRKIDRQFRGYENDNLYSDYKNGDLFKIRIIKFENSDYDSIDKLEQEMKAKYGKYYFKKENISSKNKKNKDEKIILLIFAFFAIMALFCFSMVNVS